MHGCRASHDDASAAGDGGARRELLVPEGWRGPQWSYLHDTMTQCLIHEGVVASCPPKFPKREVTKMSDAGYDPYTYELKGDPVTLCCAGWTEDRRGP